MKVLNMLALLALLVVFSPVSVLAQVADDRHPILDKRFHLGAGVYFPDKNFKLSVAGRADPELRREIDFEEALKIDNSETTSAAEFRWQFGEKWSVAGQYWTISDSSTAVLTEPIEWEDVVFKEGTIAGAGVELDVARLFFGRVFSSGSQYEFGAGAGLHWLQTSAYIEGQIKTSLGDTEEYRGSVSVDAPLPNIGAWYTYSWSPKWAFSTRVDWLSASVGDYSGSLWNASAAINWAVFEHFGVTAAWNFFKLDVDVDKSDWRGSVKSEQNGPYLAVTAYW
jgi:hypothetical protein